MMFGDAPISRPRAYSYVRFSSKAQGEGDSARRQTAMAEAYSAEHGLDLDRTLSVTDEGVSAFRGRNSKDSGSALSQFRERVRDGEVPSGSYLLIESLDRLSRQKARQALHTLEDICAEGIVVVTLTDGAKYTNETLDDDWTSLFMALFVMVRANEESARKSHRATQVWGAKRAKAAEKPLTAMCPGWLTIRPDRSGFDVIPERAEVVREIYQRYANGEGFTRIVEDLNSRGEPTWDRAKRDAPSLWHRSYVTKILRNPAVLGTYQPCKIEHDPNGKPRREPLEPVEGYYPAVVDRDLWERVKAMSVRRKDARPSVRPPVKGEVQNVLAGLARCPTCGGTMTRVNKGASPRNGYSYLVCVKAKAAAGCDYRTVQLDPIERFLRGNGAQIAADAPKGEGAEEASAALATVTANLAGLEAYAEEVADDLTRAFNPTDAALLRRLGQDIAALQAEREVLRARVTATAPAHVGRGLDRIAATLSAVPFDRGAANAALRTMLDGVVVDQDAGALRFRWRHGGESVHFWRMPSGPAVAPPADGADIKLPLAPAADPVARQAADHAALLGRISACQGVMDLLTLQGDAATFLAKMTPAQQTEAFRAIAARMSVLAGGDT